MKTCHQCQAELQPGARFCGQCGTQVVGTTPAVPATGERRQLTVMFADLAGFTEQATQLDPEDLQAFLGAYHAACREAVVSYGGVVAEYLGDGVVAYFGYPVAREDAARQAIRAALRIVQRAGSIEAVNSRPTNVRVGIATGVVVTQPERGPGNGPRVIGEVLTLAARLQTAAPLNGVIVGDTTKRLAGDIFRYDGPIQQELKGFLEPVNTWQVHGERTEPQGTEAAAPFAGRADALRALKQRWELAFQGHGGTVAVVGEPGIGKSRLLAEFRTKLPPEALVPSIRVDAHEQSAAFLPLRQWLMRATHLEGSKSSDPLGRLTQALSNLWPEIPQEDVGLLASLLDISTPDINAAAMMPQRWRAQVQRTIVDLIAGMARQQPLCMIWEDLHWLDTSSREVLSALATKAADQPLLLAVTMRPEPGTLTLVANMPVLRLDLGRLDDGASAAMVKAMAGDALSEDVVGAIMARADGVPLFLEELTRFIVESPEAADGRHKVQVPATLVDSLTTRLDRTGPAKDLAQIGAVIGRNFHVRVAAALGGISQQQVEEQAGVLREAGLIVPDTAGSYAFRHALIRDTAYETLLRRRRRDLHSQLGDWLVRNDPAVRPDEVARHLTNAERTLDAAPFWRQAGEAAAGQAAFAEAEAHFRQGIEMLSALEEKDAHTEATRSSLLASLGATLMQTQGFAAPGVYGAYEEAYGIVSRFGGAPGQLIPVLWGFFIHQMMVGKIDAASRISQELRSIAASVNDPDLKLVAEVTVGGACFYSGDFRGMVAQNAYVRAHYERERHRPFAAAYGMDLLNQGLLFEAHARWFMGEADRVAPLIAEADENGERLQLPLMEPYTEIWGAAALIYAGHLEQAIDRLERGIALADRQGFTFWSVTGRVWRAIAAMESGDVEAGLPVLSENLAILEMIGNGIGMPFFKAVRAHALAQTGNLEEALPLASAAVQQSQESGDGCWRAEVLRLFGEVQAQAGNRDQAFEAFDHSMAFAGGQGAHAWQLRTAISRTRHAWPEDSARAKQALLTLVHSAGPHRETRDLAEARGLAADCA